MVRFKRSNPDIQGKNWPPRSVENWVQVLVVADGKMVDYHGDKLQRYILTLMQTVILTLRKITSFPH